MGKLTISMAIFRSADLVQGSASHEIMVNMAGRRT